MKSGAKQHKPGEQSAEKASKKIENAAGPPSPEDKKRALNARMADQLRRVGSAPGGFDFISFANAVLDGKLNRDDANTAGDLLVGVISVVYKAAVKNDDIARKQLAAIDRMVNPLDYGLELTDIEKIANVKMNQSLIRAWGLLEIMRRLSFVLEASNSGLVKMKKNISTIEQKQCGSKLFELVKKRKHWGPKKRPRLKSLAIDLYIELNGKVQEDTLYRDLNKAKKWLAKNPGGLMKLMPAGAGIDFIPAARTRNFHW